MTLPSGLPETVSDEEQIARFVLFSGWFSSNGVKAEAFLPNPKNGDTSVSRTRDMSLEGIRQTGISVAKQRQATFYGHASLQVRSVTKLNLAVVPQEPPDAHANIANWPSVPGDPSATKAKWKLLANELRVHSKFFPET